MGSNALANQQVASRIAVTKKTWLQERQDPPLLELVLSDGRYLRILWDEQYATRALFVGATLDADTVTACMGEETGLDADLLGRLVDEVHEAVEQFGREQDREASGWDVEADFAFVEGRR